VRAADPAERDGLRQLRRQLTAAGGQPAPAPETAGQAAAARRAARRALEQAAAALARPAPDALRTVAADLHRALSGVADDTRLRQQADRMLGLCYAELHRAGPAADNDQALREAVVHLNRALMAEDHALPTVERAETLGVLASCLREAAGRDDGPPASTAERVSRAALRELADCVMIAEGTSQAVDVAARANELVASAIGWCLADDRPGAAASIAETGRGLVLASVVVSGRAGEILRAAGQHEAAEAWRTGSQTGRATALTALRETTAGSALLSAPIGEQTAITMVGTRFDAVVYLVPPTGPASRTGHAILVRPTFGQVEVVGLPGLAEAGGQAPLAAYLAALDSALAGYDPELANEDGFRGQPGGQAWAGALDNLGRWAYARIMGPLLDHVRGWSLGRLPHLALIPIGELAAIPYAAAWTDGPAGGDRRYAIDETVLSYAASARLLGETARRPRQPLSERVVLVASPRGDLPMIRRATRLLAGRQYPGAEVYGRRMAGSRGHATVAELLGALPARDRPGASLLQLSTHGSIDPAPALEASDGLLALTRILDQARDRPADAPGGLVITNACLTDTTRTHYDESLTLATAFLAAGATAVIGTRWPVDDDTAAIFSLRLHFHLQVGCHPAEALRRAQLDLLRPAPAIRDTLDPHLADVPADRLSHPATWAGHVHHGI
jgi:hypothetical protein